MRQAADGRYVLVVGDNGVGFPEDTDFRKTGSLGMKLVNSLTSQLDGTIELARSGGTTFTITFAELIYKERG
jgi:two-component sensor histidine kinase